MLADRGGAGGQWTLIPLDLTLRSNIEKLSYYKETQSFVPGFSWYSAVLMQVSCGVVRRANTANLAESGYGTICCVHPGVEALRGTDFAAPEDF